LKYRAEIDGLRALAVVPVILSMLDLFYLEVDLLA
jgi:peptidoglycan/LPS O-acetylase OafA/YrhL